jgi:hypothetical protein
LSEKATQAHFLRKHGERSELEIPGEERRGELEGANTVEKDEAASPRVRRRIRRGMNQVFGGVEGIPPRIEAAMVVALHFGSADGSVASSPSVPVVLAASH